MIAIQRTIFTISLGILAVALPARGAESVRTITVHAKRYKFLPAEITVSKGEPVRLILISDDVDHGLAVRDLGAPIGFSAGSLHGAHLAAFPHKPGGKVERPSNPAAALATPLEITISI